MPTNIQAAAPSRMVWAGWVLSALAVLFMLFDAVIKLMVIEPVRQSMGELGYPLNLAIVIAIVELIATALYVFPRTAVLGAILLTGVYGGAIASHLRIGSPLFSHVLFGLYLGLFVWGGAYLRDEKLRAVFPWRR